MTILNQAVAKGDLQAVRDLIEDQGYLTDYTGFTGYDYIPLAIAAQFGQRKVAEYLIQKGADINAKGHWGLDSTPIEYAIFSQQTQSIVTLLINNATLPKEMHKTTLGNHYLLKAASMNDTWSIEKLLANTEADINTHDVSFMYRTPLHNAVMNESFDATVTLIEKGAKINAIDVHSWTPLHYAASNNDSQFATLLIEKGAKINALDVNGRSPLFAAAQYSGEEELINLLVKHGAKINQTDNDNISVLDIAIINDHADVIKCLVFNGAKIGANSHNTTPLEYAAESGKLQALEALIELDSSLNHKNNAGKSAIELAFKSGEMGAVNILIMHGADVPKAIQAKLDLLKPVDLDEVLPENSQDNIVTPATIIIEDHGYMNPTGSTSIVPPVYDQPIGPVLGNIEPTENSGGVGGVW